MRPDHSLFRKLADQFSLVRLVGKDPARAEGEGTLLSQPVGVEPIAELAVDSTGEFRISLPPGTYLLAAQMVGGYAWWTQWVEVNPGGYTPITITCYIR